MEICNSIPKYDWNWPNWTNFTNYSSILVTKISQMSPISINFTHLKSKFAIQCQNLVEMKRIGFRFHQFSTNHRPPAQPLTFVLCYLRRFRRCQSYTPVHTRPQHRNNKRQTHVNLPPPPFPSSLNDENRWTSLNNFSTTESKTQPKFT